jgi:hypothetical protein
MASRKEQKELLRRERIARQEAAAAARARRQRIRIGGAVLGGVAVIAVAAVLIGSSTGGGSSDRVTGSATPIPAAAKVGLQATPAPWPPESSHLAERLAALKFPQASEGAFHIHALLSVFVNGKQEPVPANVGIDPGFRFMAPLHTHDNSGLVHIESSKPRPFTIGEFFAIWGVAFSKDRLGAYRDQGGRSVQVYVDGRRVADPVNYVLQRHDDIVVAYGRPGSFPKKPPASFPAGL